MKLVSVIIPVYNVEAYIASAIESVLAQTYDNFELIIVDDGCSNNLNGDRSIEICQQFQDSRIKIISQENRGLAGARNTGIRNAQGDYLAFLDGDDVWMPEKLAKHLQHLNSNSEVGVSFSRSAFIDSTGKLLGTYQMPKLIDITAQHLLCENSVGNGSAPVIRKQVFKEICFRENRYGFPEDFYFDEDFRRSEDLECWIRIVLQTSWKIEGISSALTLYRVNDQGLSASVFKQLASWEQVITKTKQYAPELIAQWEKPAKAHQLFYLARQAIRFKDGKTAVTLINQALSTHWQIIKTKPRSTLLITMAGYLQYILPRFLYSTIESLALKVRKFLQKKTY